MTTIQMHHTRELAATLAQERLDDLTNFESNVGPIEWYMGFRKLLAEIHLHRHAELDDASKRDQGGVKEDFAAEAGFLLGLELGKRLEGLKHGGDR